VSLPDSIGSQIHQLRIERGMTLNQLAKATDLSSPYLSQLENDKASPSINTLRRIANSLKVNIVDFFAHDLVQDPPVMPQKNWTKVTLPDWEATMHQLVHVVGNKRMQPFHTLVPPGGGTKENYSHPGEEFGFVLEGRLTLRLRDEVHLLEPNTAVYYSSLIPHSWLNEQDEPCRLIWVLTPPSW
jgi:DNA-binding XRE family transcriptional regulator